MSSRMADDTMLTREEFERLIALYQQAVIEAVDAKFNDIETHLLRLETSLDTVYGKMLERHERLLTGIAGHLGLGADSEVS